MILILALSLSACVIQLPVPNPAPAPAPAPPTVVEPAPVPEPPHPVWRPTRAELLNIRANFISLKDQHGRMMLSWFYPSLDNETQQEWREAWRAAGVTHVVLCPVMAYPGYWAPGGDWRFDPGRFAEAVRDLLNAHLIPILFLSSGDGGTGAEPPILFPGYVKALKERDLLPYVWLVPGFEVVGPGGGWTSLQLSVALELLHERAPDTPLGVHLQPERATGASHPIESDDPWQGCEPCFWTSHGGEYAAALFYQAPHGPKLLDASRTGTDSWEDRFVEILDRLGTGGRGWRKVSVSFFEGTGYDFYRGFATPTDTQRIAQRAQTLCRERNVSCGFGDGVPRE